MWVYMKYAEPIFLNNIKGFLTTSKTVVHWATPYGQKIVQSRFQKQCFNQRILSEFHLMHNLCNINKYWCEEAELQERNY